MLFSFSAADASGTVFPLPEPCSFSLSLDEDSPAHSFSARFFLQHPLPPLHVCEISLDETQILSALLDEQSFSCSADGSFLTLSGRSRTALLLDNDAPPQTYVNPSLKQLFACHAAPFGFTEITGNSGRFRGQFVVRKGMSHWQALSDFCAYFLGTTLRSGPARSLDASGKPSEHTVRFSNHNGIPYFSLSKEFLFQKQVSHLYLQPALGAPYSSLVVDQPSVDLGILRSRYLSLSPFLAKRSLEASRRHAMQVTLRCPQPLFHMLSLGDPACVDDPDLGLLSGLSVAKVSFSLSEDSLLSCVTLRPVVNL